MILCAWNNDMKSMRLVDYRRTLGGLRRVRISAELHFRKEVLY